MKNLKATLNVCIVLATTTLFTFTALAQEEAGQALSSAPSASVDAKVGSEPTVGSDQRPPFFVNGMTVGAFLHEDGDNRLTSKDSRALFSPGLAIRAGGVINDKHLIGGFFQGSWRETRNVADSLDGDDKWGAVSSYFIGTEYRYITDFGLYFGASAGLGFTVAINDMDNDDSPDCDSFECVQDYLQTSEDHISVGLGVRGTLGYEYRFTRYFALNTEAFVGVLAGEDEDGKSMTTPTYGLAFGVGI